MDSVAVTVPLRPPTKKMKKRKELDALAAPHAITRRNSGKRSSQELLTDSSDDRSEYWSVSTRGGRKCRGSRRGRPCPGFLRACSAFLACASILATATLIWLFIDVRQQLSALRTELDQVIAGNEGVPDTLQKYHSLSRDLQNNQTIIFANITDIKLQIANFTTQLSSIQHDLHDVQETIQAAPELVNVPNKLKDLSIEISTWGSKITDLISTTDASKENDRKIENVQANILKNITTMEQLLSDLSSVTQQPQAVLLNESKAQNELMSSTIAELAANLSTVNTTLTRNLQWVKDDQNKHDKTLVQLQEMSQNLTAKVMSLDGECAKITTQETLRLDLEKLTAEIDLVQRTDVKLQAQIQTLENAYNLLRNSSDAMLASIKGLRNSQPNTAAQNDGTIPSILNPGSAEIPKITETESPSESTGGVAGEVLKNDQVSTEQVVPDST